MPFQDVLYYCVFLYLLTPRQTLPCVTKEVDKSEEPYSSLTIKGASLDQWKIKFFHTFPLLLKFFVKTFEVEKSFDFFFPSLWCFRTFAYNDWNNMKQSKGFLFPDVLKRSSNIDERNQALKLVLITCVVN